MNEDRLSDALAKCPLIAILRGIRPDEVVEIGIALVGQGIGVLEVPLNSPQPYDSIARLVQGLPEGVVVGAGTVLSSEDVSRLEDSGGQLVVSPNTNISVISAARVRGLACLPGFVTPTEAFCAIDAGASGLKLFPADSYGPAYLQAIRAVLPPEVPLLPVGGISPGNLAPWVAAGASGFGTGSGLYKPGMTARQVEVQAAAFVAAIRTAGILQ